MPMAEKTCVKCGSSALEEEFRGVDQFLVCHDCGCMEDAAQQQFLPDHQPYTNYRPLEAPLRHHTYTDRNSQYRNNRYQKDKEKKLRVLVRELCGNLKLPEHEIKVCEDEMLALSREGVVSNKWKAKETAAGIVYLACQRHCPVSFRQMEDICKVTVKRVSSVVKMLKGRQINFDSTQSGLCGENRLSALLEGFTFDLQPNQSKDVLKTAVDIWELVGESRMGKRKLHVAQTVTADLAVIAIAVEYVKKNRLEESETIQLANSVNVTPDSLKTRMYKIRKGVMEVSMRIPEIAAAVQQKKLTKGNFARLLPSILRMKELILATRESPETTSPEPDPSGSGEVAAVANGEPFRWNDSDSDLSDLDVDEYIASKEEVAEREKLYEQL